MTEAEFRQGLGEGGYDEIVTREYPPNADGAMHTHEFSVRLLVLDGEFTLALENEAKTYGPGETCELAAGTLHCERAGASGASVIAGLNHTP